jgi:hypothetical protein
MAPQSMVCPSSHAGHQRTLVHQMKGHHWLHDNSMGHPRCQHDLCKPRYQNMAWEGHVVPPSSGTKSLRIHHALRGTQRPLRVCARCSPLGHCHPPLQHQRYSHCSSLVQQIRACSPVPLLQTFLHTRQHPGLGHYAVTRTDVVLLGVCRNHGCPLSTHVLAPLVLLSEVVYLMA